MKINRVIILPMIGILMLSGCAHYRSTGRATIKTPDNWVYSEQAIDSETQALEDIASKVVGYDGAYKIQHTPDTTLFLVSVTTSDPDNSATLCNKIIDTYISMTNAPFKRELIDKAEPCYGRVWK